MKQVTKFAMVLISASSVSACGTSQETVASASDTAQTSICQIDRKIPVRPAPDAGIDDPGNQFDTDATSDALLEHNARYDAACPD